MMEDAATAEISRTQIWQWIHHGVELDDGRTVTHELVRQVLDEETAKIREQVGDETWAAGRPDETREIFEGVALSPELDRVPHDPGLPLPGLGPRPTPTAAERSEASDQTARISSPTAISPSRRMSARRPPAVHERSQHRPIGIALDDRARLAQPHAAAPDLPDRELMSDQRVQVDAPRDDVPAVLARRERRLERLAHLGLDHRQRAARETRRERAGPRHVPISLEAAARQRADGGEQPGRLARRVGDRQRVDRAHRERRRPPRRKRERDVRGRDDERCPRSTRARARGRRPGPTRPPKGRRTSRRSGGRLARSTAPATRTRAGPRSSPARGRARRASATRSTRSPGPRPPTVAACPRTAARGSSRDRPGTMRSRVGAQIPAVEPRASARFSRLPARACGDARRVGTVIDLLEAVEVDTVAPAIFIKYKYIK